MSLLAVAALSLAALCRAAEPAGPELQERILRARARILPATVYIHVVGREYDKGEAKRAVWSGSGVILSTDGFVATNHHVLQQAQRVRVMLSDRRAYEAVVVGTDELTDLGLVRLTLPPGHPPLPTGQFGDSAALTAGDFVMAVGSPLGLTRSVSLGIVNNPAQSLFDGDLYNWIQTDAAINPGNSGGPLVDIEGRVVGINTRGAGGYGLGFAIPSAVARAILARLKTDGRVERGDLGVTLQSLRDFDRDSYIEGERGVLAVGVQPNSAAAAAGLRGGDLILSAGGAATDALYPEDMPAVRRVLASLTPDRPAKLEILRAGGALTLTAVPKRRPVAAGEERSFEAAEWMLTAREIRPDEDSLNRFLREKGCFVLGVSEGGNAHRSGLEPQDILLAVDGAPIASLDDLGRVYRKSLERPPTERLILFSVLRRARLFKVALDYSRSRASQEEER